MTTATLMRPRAYDAMAYDAARRRIMMFGGQSGLVRCMGDTWFVGAQSPASVVPYGTGCAGTGGVPLLGSGVPYLGNPNFTLDVVSANPNAACLFGIDFAKGGTPVGGCTLYLASISVVVPTATNAGGYAQIGFAIPPLTALIGGSLFSQAFVVDPLGPVYGLAFTAGLEVLLGD